MAQNISVARAVFTTSLLRSDPPAPDVSREDATIFARTLLRTCNICTTSNVKLCKSFIVKYILPSRVRTAAVTKYLVALSKAFEPRDPEARIDTTKPGDENEGLGKILNGKVQQPPEPAFKRLHVLYIIHDVLCHSHFHRPREDIPAKLQQDVFVLAELAAAACSGKTAKTSPYILDIISYWETSAVYEKDLLEQLREKIRVAEKTDWAVALAKLTAEEESRALEERRLKADDTKWTIPDRHGVLNDPSAPWHELPAANGLYMRRTYGYPLRAAAFPAGGFRLKHAGEEASEDLKQSVSTLYSEALRSFDKFTPANDMQDIDALGNIIWKDPERPTRNFWGFTIDGIDKRKDLAKTFAETAGGYEAMEHLDGRYGSDIDRARALAGDRGRGMGRGRGFGPPRAAWRGGRRW